MSCNHTKRAVVHVRWPERGVSFRETAAGDSDVPSPVEERRTHDSGWEDDLYTAVRNPNCLLVTGVYLVCRRVEVRVDHRRVHLPLQKVPGLSEFLPSLDLVIDTKGKQRTVRKSMGWTERNTYAAFNMFSKNLSSLIFTNE